MLLWKGIPMTALFGNLTKLIFLQYSKISRIVRFTWRHFYKKGYIFSYRARKARFGGLESFSWIRRIFARAIDNRERERERERDLLRCINWRKKISESTNECRIEYTKGELHGTIYSFEELRSKLAGTMNQSRICGEVVGLGFSFWLAPIPVIRTYWNCTHRPYYGVENDCRNFRSDSMDRFCENQKKSENDYFLTILATFLTFQSNNFDAFEHTGAPLGVEWLCQISWKSDGQFLRNLKLSWKGREEKNTIA